MTLSESQRQEILAIVSVGCSRRTAARFAGCTLAAIQEAARRDPAFGQRLRQVERRAEIGSMKSIQRAGGQEKHWRAAAWALERMNPEDFAPRKPAVLTVDQLGPFLTELAEILTEEIPVAAYRQGVLRRVERLIADVRDGQKEPSR